MPALPDVNHVLKVVHEGDMAGLPWAGVSHWRYVMSGGGEPTSAQLLVVGAKFVNSWRDNIRPITGIECSDSHVVLLDLTSPTAATATSTDGDAGTHDVMVSQEACLLVTKSVGRRYRGGHPRTYWPGLSRDHTNVPQCRTVDPAQLAAVQARYTSYYTDIPPAVTTDGDTGMSSFHEVQVSYHSGGVLRTVPVVDDILSYTVQPVLATQRRRMHRS